MKKKIKKEIEDIKLLALPAQKQSEELGVPDYFSILTDCKPLVPFILTKQVVEILHEQSKNIELFHFTDQYSKNKSHRGVLRFIFSLPKRGEIKNLKTLLQMTLYFIDHISEINLSPQVLKQQKDLRLKAQIVKRKETSEEREEAKQKN